MGERRYVLRELREARGWSQAALARRLGVASQTIWHWEVGRHTPSARLLEQVAALFGVAPEALVFATPARYAPPVPPAPPIDGAAIRALRLLRGWTQAALAAKLGVGVDAVGRWETGRARPALYQRARLAEVLADPRTVPTDALPMLQQLALRVGGGL